MRKIFVMSLIYGLTTVTGVSAQYVTPPAQPNPPFVTPVVPAKPPVVLNELYTNYPSPFEQMPAQVPLVDDTVIIPVQPQTPIVIPMETATMPENVVVPEVTPKKVVKQKTISTPKKSINDTTSASVPSVPIVLVKPMTPTKAWNDIKPKHTPSIPEIGATTFSVTPSLRAFENNLAKLSPEVLPKMEVMPPPAKNSSKTTWIIGLSLLFMSLGWLALKRHVLFGDPALRDPWFKPTN